VTGNERVKNRFSRISSTKVNRLTSNQDHNDDRRILHIIIDCISTADMPHFADNL